LKNYKKYNLFPILILFFTNCTGDETKEFAKTLTVDMYIFGKDTCNLTDIHGWKQGKWVPHNTNKLKDTVFYKNDTLLKP